MRRRIRTRNLEDEEDFLPSYSVEDDEKMYKGNNRTHIGRKVMKAAALIGSVSAVGAIGVGLSMGFGIRALVRRRRSSFSLNDKVVVITGGSRGLGFALAEECVRLGAVVAICARDQDELLRAKEILVRRYGAEVFQQVCDVTVSGDVNAFIDAVLARFGRIDVLINNAGVIGVGPQNTQTLPDYEEAMDIMYWGVVYPTLVVLPDMRRRREGRIANITSIGGKISVPHLVPYCSAKFAAVGFSEGMRAELKRDGIKVTTVCPGLMRTGSHLNAEFKGDHRREFHWFALAATLPFVSMDAHRAARKIIRAIQNGDAELILTPQAKFAVLANGIAPGAVSDVLGIVNRALPDAQDHQQERRLGRESQTTLTRSFVTTAGRKAAEVLNQNPEQRSA